MSGRGRRGRPERRARGTAVRVGP